MNFILSFNIMIFIFVLILIVIFFYKNLRKHIYNSKKFEELKSTHFALHELRNISIILLDNPSEDDIDYYLTCLRILISCTIDRYSTIVMNPINIPFETIYNRFLEIILKYSNDRSRDIEIINNIEKQTVILFIDVQRIIQALLNLGMNMIKFSEEKCKITFFKKNKNLNVIFYNDTGLNKKDSTGFGLRVTKSILKEMGASYNIVLNNKDFYCVCIEFPIIEGIEIKFNENLNNKQFKILYADDSMINLKVFKKLFSNHIITTTTKLDEVIELLKNEKFDFCFLDNVMGNFRGIDFIDRVLEYVEAAIITGSSIETKHKVFLKPFDKILIEGWMYNIGNNNKK